MKSFKMYNEHRIAESKRNLIPSHMMGRIAVKDINSVVECAQTKDELIEGLFDLVDKKFQFVTETETYIKLVRTDYCDNKHFLVAYK